jgi:hypothetical protein
VTDYFDVYKIYVVDDYEPPVADAGEDQTVNEGDLVALDGRNSRGSGNIIWDPHLVGLYHMNEGSGNVLHDSTPYENHGTLVGPTWTSYAKWGNALSFDGIDDYVEIKPNDEIFGENPNEWSYFVWFRTNNCLENMSILSDKIKHEASAIDSTIEHHMTRDGFVVWASLNYRYPSGGLGHGIGKGGNYTDGNWYFISVTVSKIEDVFKLFVNGYEENQAALPGNPGDYFTGSELRIGARDPLNYAELPDRLITPFDGIIEEIALFNRTLSAGEIYDIYHSGKEYFSKDSSVITSYEWDLDASDGLWWETGAVPDATGPTPTHVYGDDGIFIVTLRVTDENGEQDTDTCNITVLNIDPIVEIDSATMDVEIGLRVAGRKFNDVGMTLSENEKIAGYVSIERMPGSPDDQMAWIPMTLNLSRTYSAVVTYTPEDPPNIGGNPTWIYIKFPNGSIQKIHHTFNVQQSKKRNSGHWNHIEPWEVDLNAHLVGWEFEVDHHVSDPGSDDEHLNFEYGSQTMSYVYYNNAPIDSPDPYPSPEVNPRNILDTIELIYEGPGTLSLEVMDDDNIRLSTSGLSTSIELA